MTALRAGCPELSVPQSSVRASLLKLSGERVSGRELRSTPQAEICSGVTTFLNALRMVLRRWENAAETTPAKCGLTAKAGSRRTMSRTTADQTLGGGWNAPGPTSNSDSAFTHGEIGRASCRERV